MPTPGDTSPTKTPPQHHSAGFSRPTPSALTTPHSSASSTPGNTLTATSGTGLRVCSSTVNGPTTITGIHGVILIGEAGDDGSPNTVIGTRSGQCTTL
jgi:hypothetical protein